MTLLVTGAMGHVGFELAKQAASAGSTSWLSIAKASVRTRRALWERT